MELLRPENEYSGSKWFLEDIGLSLSGKGLLMIILMLPEKININKSLFYRLCGDKEEVVNKTFKELEKLKYVIYVEKDDSYIIYEKPIINN